MPSKEQVFETGEAVLMKSRSGFDLSFKNTITMTSGFLYPVFCYSDVFPSDSHKLSAGMVARSTTPITAVMDDSYIQVEFWWIPNQILLSRASMSPSVADSVHSWRAFMGAQDSLLNVGLLDSYDPLLPVLPFDGSGTGAHAIYLQSPAHYLDYPFLNFELSDLTTSLDVTNNPDADLENKFFNPFALLAFYQVWSDAYREPNLWNPVTYSIKVSNGINYISFTPNDQAGISSLSNENIFGLTMPRVCREHGYFGSALPWAQRAAQPVNLIGDFAPLAAGLNAYELPLDADPGGDALGIMFGHSSGQSTSLEANVVDYGSGTSYDGVFTSYLGSVDSSQKGVPYDRTNLYADLRQYALTVNSLRYNFALQAYYEALNRMGNRYEDIIRQYGVSVDRCSSCHSEYLGGKRIPLNMTQVAATAYAGNPLGSIGAFSNTSDFSKYFSKSFTDFGVIVGVAFIRHHDTPVNRLSRERSRIRRFDYYNPFFARIGEVPIRTNELFIPTGLESSVIPTGKTVQDLFEVNKEFGFQEYAADYRYHEDGVHGQITPYKGNNNAYWTYATDWENVLYEYGDDYDSFNLGYYLNGENMRYDFDQTLQVSSDTAKFQFIVQFYFQWTAVRGMYKHSIPAMLGQR